MTTPVTTTQTAKRWLVSRSYMATQECELTLAEAATAEDALRVARERFGTLVLEDAGDGCSSDIDTAGDSVFDLDAGDDADPVLEAD